MLLFLGYVVFLCILQILSPLLSTNIFDEKGDAVPVLISKFILLTNAFTSSWKLLSESHLNSTFLPAETNPNIKDGTLWQ